MQPNYKQWKKTLKDTVMAATVFLVNLYIKYSESVQLKKTLTFRNNALPFAILRNKHKMSKNILNTCFNINKYNIKIRLNLTKVINVLVGCLYDLNISYMVQLLNLYFFSKLR